MQHRSSWRSVRQSTSDDLHACLGRLSRQRLEGEELSEGQEDWWDEMVTELVWRSARSRRPYRQCGCYLCLNDTTSSC